MSNGFILHVRRNGLSVTDLPIVNSGVYTVGRGEQANIKIASPDISRVHLTIIFENGVLKVRDESSANGTFWENTKLQENELYDLSHSSEVFLGGEAISLYFDIETAVLPTPQSLPENNDSEEGFLKLLEAKGEVLIGRTKECDFVLNSTQVSRRHALVRQTESRIEIQDLGSKNGTFVNGERISEPTQVNDTDQITIGTTTFLLNKGVVEVPNAIVAEKIEKVYSNGYIGLNKMSLKIASRDFVALMGPSGCGKSTLLKALNGANPITGGQITIQGLKLNNANYEVLKKHIGYVPQDDIVHGALTVGKTLFYAAKLRMANDVSNDEINEKIDSVLKSLNLDADAIRHNKVEELSGGQRKRISIAVELLNDPAILFLDEPTSPLDPETIEDFLTCIKGLARGGQTVIMVTHKPSDLNYVDKVIFLSKGGFQTYYGGKDSLISHFNTNNIIEIYSLMKDERLGEAWHKEWLAKNPELEGESNYEKFESKPKNSISLQYFWLSLRYLNLKLNDRWNMALLLGQPVIISLLLTFMFKELQLSVLFLMALSAVWFGVSNASKEIVSELPIYERERMYNLNIANYVLSKITILSLFAFMQVIVFVTVIYNAFELRESEVRLWTFWPYVWFMFYLSVASTTFGLFLSSIFKNTEKVMTFVPIALIPQIVLAGVIALLNNNFKVFLSYFMLGRWGTEGFAHIQDQAAIDQSEWADPGETVPASIMRMLPSPNTGTSPTLRGGEVSQNQLELQPSGAVNQLGFYEPGGDLISLFPQNVFGVYVAVTIIFCGFYFLTYLSLKLKDTKFA